MGKQLPRSCDSLGAACRAPGDVRVGGRCVLELFLQVTLGDFTTAPLQSLSSNQAPRLGEGSDSSGFSPGAQQFSAAILLLGAVRWQKDPARAQRGLEGEAGGTSGHTAVMDGGNRDGVLLLRVWGRTGVTKLSPHRGCLLGEFPWLHDEEC